MFLEKLSVLNFKNHSDSRLDFNPNINCFVGDNGSGKTNLLDAIHYLSFTKSFFIKQDRMNVLYYKDFMSIEGIFEKTKELILDLIVCKNLTDVIATTENSFSKKFQADACKVLFFKENPNLPKGRILDTKRAHKEIGKKYSLMLRSKTYPVGSFLSNDEKVLYNIDLIR